FDAVIPRLPALRELGITAVELMPVAQFPGSRNWGYDGVHPFAPQNTYGGPHGLQRLVDACHREGLAAFLDVVYNHLGPEGNYITAARPPRQEIVPTSPEFAPSATARSPPPGGPAFNFAAPGSAAVRPFVLDTARQWVGDYPFAGLPLDAVHAMIDTRPRHILA